MEWRQHKHGKHTSGLRHVLVLFLLSLSLFANVALPKGSMVERDSQTGKISIGVCTAQGLLTHWLDVRTGEITPQESGGEEGESLPQTCAFATSGAVMANEGILRTVILNRSAVPHTLQSAPTSGFVGQTPIRLAARGPPNSL